MVGQEGLAKRTAAAASLVQEEEASSGWDHHLSPHKPRALQRLTRLPHHRSGISIILVPVIILRTRKSSGRIVK